MATAPLSELPFRRARVAPDGPCLVGPAGTCDNAGFASAVLRCAARLQAMGVDRGDIVAVMLPNSSESVVAMFAAWHRGAALTPLNPELTDDEARHQLQDSSAVVLIGDTRSRDLAGGVGIGWIDATTLLASDDRDESVAGEETGALAEPEDFALVIYTSGSSSKPYGVLLDHANLEAMSATMADALGLGAGDASLLVLPLFHVNGIIVSLLSALRVGGHVVVAPRFAPETFWDLVAQHRPTYFSAVPTIYALLDARTSGGVDSSSLRLAVCGAAPLPVELMERFEKRFDVPIVEGYGITECSVAATLNPVEGPRKPGSVGLPLAGQEVAIVDTQGHAVPPGVRGEVVVRGPHVMRGYLGLPEETAKVLRDGWLHTGELGLLDPDGYLVLVDRIKDVIVRGGVEVQPREIEDALYQHSSVLEAAVVGRPDPVLGEVPVAYVSAKPGLVVTAEELRAHCAATLARYKLPTAIHVYAELPRSSAGKLVKGMLLA